MMAQSSRFACAIVLIFASFIFLFQLGTKPFWDYDEALYANVIQDTLQSGDVLTLQSHGSPYFDKPPLSFWTSMGIDSMLQYPELSYRLTAAFASITSIVLVMLITYEITQDLFIAAIAGAILCTTGPFIQAGRELRLDVPAIAMILFSVYSFIRGLKNPKWFLGVGVGLALGFMFKSIVGLLSIPFFIVWSLYNRDVSYSTSNYFWLSGIVFFLILLPWHLYESIQFGTTFWNGFMTIVAHIGGDTLGGSYSALDYLKFFFTYAAPWSIAFVFAVMWLASTLFKNYRDKRTRYLYIFASTAILLFLVFLVSATKILSYLLPVYPFVAISLALICSHILNTIQKQSFAYRVFFFVATILLLCGLWVGINYGYHLFPYIATNDVIVQEEKDVAGIITKESETIPIYAYQYDYYDTIEYYSGRKTIGKMQDDQALDKQFLMLVGKEYMDWHSFPAELQAHLETLYKGQSLILYKFTP